MKKPGILLSVASGMIAAIGTKAVNAKPMTRQEYNDFRGWQLPENENGADEGCLVEYQDCGEPNTAEYKGYVSWSPKAQFDNAYQDVTKGVSFGHAVELLKAGHRVARSGWNGKGMFLYYVPENKYPASRNEHGTMVGVFENDMVPYGAYIAIKTAQNTVMPWQPSNGDMLTEDWQIVE